ncbi:MAG: enoyl-CoA hydratase [Chloroflexi bacterium]|nr:enoyl-CoA hydratase [Chloroflexota bacterium]
MDQLTRDGHIARLTLPATLDADTVALLRDACAAVAAEPEVRVLILDAPSGCWRGWPASLLPGLAQAGLAGDPFGPLAALPQPSVAVLRGDVLDAGLELALCADLRVCEAGARFGLPGVAAGRLPVAGGLQRLARAVGRSRATQLLLSDPVDAAAARDWGLVSESGDDPAALAGAVAERIAARGPIATRLAKEAVARGLEMPLDQALRYETDLTILLQSTDDRAEGVRAFLEKRPPEFRGR